MSVKDIYTETQRELAELGIVDFEVEIPVLSQEEVQDIKECIDRVQLWQELKTVKQRLAYHLNKGEQKLITAEQAVYIGVRLQGIYQVDFYIYAAEFMSNPQDLLSLVKEVGLYYPHKYPDLVGQFKALERVGALNQNTKITKKPVKSLIEVYTEKAKELAPFMGASFSAGFIFAILLTIIF